MTFILLVCPNLFDTVCKWTNDKGSFVYRYDWKEMAKSHGIDRSNCL